MTEESRVDILPEDLIPSLAGGSPASRRYAALMLGIDWPEDLGFFFMEAMENGAVPVRQAVAETLGKLCGMSRNRIDGDMPEELAGVPCLACLMLGVKDPDDTTRANSARSLGNLREEEALQALIGGLSDPAAQVRTEAARSLGIHRDPRAGPPLVAALGDADAAVRGQAAAALEPMRVEEARGPLLELLEDEDESTRTQAALALGALGAPEAVPLLIKAVQAGERWTSYSAVTYLCDMRAAEALPALKGALSRPLAIGLQRHVVRNLAKFGSGEVVPAICEALEHGGDPKFRLDAIEVLEELGDPSAVPILIQAMERWGDRGAPGALLKLGGREAEDAVIRQVNQPYSKGMDWRAARLLGANGITRAMPALRQAVEDAYPMDMVSHAAMVLARLGDTVTAPNMVEWLGHEDRDRRRRAAVALGYLGDGSATGPLMAALRDPFGKVRKSAARSLGLLGDQAAVPALTAALDDIKKGVRKAAGQALERLEEQEKAS